MLKLWKRFSDQCDYWATVAAIGMQATMFVLIIAAVVARYLIKVPMPWSEELSKILLVWTGFLGASMAAKRAEHVGFKFLIERLSGRWLRSVQVLVHLLMAVFLVALAKFGWSLAVAVGSSQKSAYLDIPYFWIYLCVPVGGVLILIHTIEQVWAWSSRGGWPK